MTGGLVCDVCGHAVGYDPVIRTFSHDRPTACRGIDGVVLSDPRAERWPAEPGPDQRRHVGTPHRARHQSPPPS